MSATISSWAEQRIMGKIHGKSIAHKAAVDFALAGIEAMINLCPRLYVSLSFGKQSICVAHLAQRIRQDIPMYFLASTETWAMYDYTQVVSQFQERFNPNLTIVQTDRLSESCNWTDARALGDNDLQMMCDRAKWDGWLWGLALDESRQRKITIAQGIKQKNQHSSIYRYADGKYRGCPIMRWGTNDLAAYIVEHDLPILNIYKSLGLTQRTTARITKKMVQEAGMYGARRFSGGLQKICADFPEIRVW